MRHLVQSFLLTSTIGVGLSVFASPSVPFLPTLPAPLSPRAAQAAKPQPSIRTGIEWKVDPPEVIVHLDGKKLGKAKDLKFTSTSPGKHTIRLVNGGDEEELEVKVVKGQVLQVVYSFED